jgi:hypothetical protein
LPYVKRQKNDATGRGGDLRFRDYLHRPVAKLIVIGYSFNDALFAVAAVGRSPAEHLLGRGTGQA